MLTREWAPGRRRVTLRDPRLPHQIVIFLPKRSSRIAVSCNCQRRGQYYAPLETRVLWEPGEAITAWRKHLAASC